jgi:hypothetical protein
MPRDRASKLAIFALSLLSLSDGCRLGELVLPHRAEEDRKAEAARSARGRDLPISALWWNRPAFVARFALAPEQRARMDAARAQFVDAQRKAGAEEEEARDAVAQMLWSGEFEDARRRAGAVTTVVAERERLRTEMMIRVLGELTEAQRRHLGAELPRLLSAPWANLATVARRGRRPEPAPASEDEVPPDPPSKRR